MKAKNNVTVQDQDGNSTKPLLSSRLLKFRAFSNETKKMMDWDFIKSVNFLKQKKYEVALSEIKKIKSNDPLFKEFQSSLIFWIKIQDKKKNRLNEIKEYKSRY